MNPGGNYLVDAVPPEEIWVTESSKFDESSPKVEQISEPANADSNNRNEMQ
jgi:hypothetical protein